MADKKFLLPPPNASRLRPTNMATNVIMPALGVAQTTGTLLKWLKSEGDSVAKGEPLMEIETDKATVEIEAPASGILTQVTAAPGDQVPVGNRIALILAPGESVPTDTKSTAPAFVRQPILRAAGGENPIAAPVAKARSTIRILASPAAKRIAREKNLDLSTLKGSGPDRAVLTQDVLGQAGAESPATRDIASGGEIIPLTPMRRIVGQRMSQSKQDAPHFYVSMDIDMTAALERRADWQESRETLIPSINDFVLWSCVRTLRDFPLFNSTFTAQGIQLHAEINIGMAVALEEGLVVPVIHDAGDMSLAEIAEQSRALIKKTQSKKLIPLDYENGTFTVSNLGMLGVDGFTAIINPPQCAILAVGRVAPRVVTDGDGMMVRSMMTATLSADHRIVDGAGAARFLGKVKQLLEKPDD